MLISDTVARLVKKIFKTDAAKASMFVGIARISVNIKDDRAGPPVRGIGTRTVWTGEEGAAGTGTRLKLVANSWVIAATNAAGETIALAQALGVDPQSFFDAIGGGGIDMPYLRLKAGLILDDALTPASFAAKTAAKDAASSSTPPTRTVSDSTSLRRGQQDWVASLTRDAATRTWPRHTLPASSSDAHPVD